MESTTCFYRHIARYCRHTCMWDRLVWLSGNGMQHGQDTAWGGI